MSSTYRKPAEDGGARGPMTRINYPAPQMTYPDLTENRAERAMDLSSLIAAAARHMLNTCPDLTPKQKQLLRDVEKGRYRFRALEQLLEIAPTALNPMSLPDALTGGILRRMPAQPECVVDATIDETIAQVALDPFQMRFLAERTPGLRDATLDRVGPNLVKLMRYRNVLLRWNPTGRRVFA